MTKSKRSSGWRSDRADAAYVEAHEYLRLAEENKDEIVAMGYRLTAQLAKLRATILEAA